MVARRIALWLVLLSTTICLADPPRRRSFDNPTLRQIQRKYTGQYYRRNNYGRKSYGYYRGHRHGRQFYGAPIYGYGWSNYGLGFGGVYLYDYLPTYSYFYSPLYEPIDPWFGLGAMSPFLDLNRLGAAGPVLQEHERQRVEMEANKPAPVVPKIVEGIRDQKLPRLSSLEARTKSRRWMQAGDNQFVNQRFNEARLRYESAAKAAPDLAEPHFRLAHTWIALGQVDKAMRAIHQAVRRTSDLQRFGFTVAELYADNRIAKNAHIEALAQKALDDPQDHASLFLIGFSLRYDGQLERAEKFFKQAAAAVPDNVAYRTFADSKRAVAGQPDANQGIGL